MTDFHGGTTGLPRQRQLSWRDSIQLPAMKNGLILAQTGCYCKFNIEATRFTGGG